MENGRSYTAAAIAQIVEKSKQAIMKRAKKESWQGMNGNGRGGNHLKYPFPSLPQDVQLAIYNKEGAPAEMLPMLSPAVALAEMERPVAVPTFADTVRPTQGAKRGRRKATSRAGSLLPGDSPAAPASNVPGTRTDPSGLPVHVPVSERRAMTEQNIFLREYFEKTSARLGMAGKHPDAETTLRIWKDGLAAWEEKEAVYNNKDKEGAAAEARTELLGISRGIAGGPFPVPDHYTNV